jgi:hypothetical protein
LLVDHGVSANAQHVVAAPSSDECLRHTKRLVHLERLDGHTGGNGSQKGKLDRPGRGFARQDLDRPALVVIALDVAFALEIGQMFVDRGERVVAEVLSDLLEAWRKAVLLGVRREIV